MIKLETTTFSCFVVVANICWTRKNCRDFFFFLLYSFSLRNRTMLMMVDVEREKQQKKSRTTTKIKIRPLGSTVSNQLVLLNFLYWKNYGGFLLLSPLFLCIFRCSFSVSLAFFRLFPFLLISSLEWLHSCVVYAERLYSCVYFVYLKYFHSIHQYIGGFEK